MKRDFLKRFTIDYNTECYRNYYIRRVAIVLYMFFTLVIPVTIPLAILDIKKSKKAPPGEKDGKFLLASFAIHSAVINSVFFGTITFCILKKYAKEGLVNELSNEHISLISFVAVPGMAVLYSLLITAVLYKVRKHESCVGDIAQNVALDTYFTNPVTGLIFAIYAFSGFVKDKIVKRKIKNEAINVQVNAEDIALDENVLVGNQAKPDNTISGQKTPEANMCRQV